MDDFLENFRTAFDPPDPFFGKYVAIFQKFMTKAVRKFSGKSSILGKTGFPQHDLVGNWQQKRTCMDDEAGRHPNV